MNIMQAYKAASEAKRAELVAPAVPVKTDSASFSTGRKDVLDALRRVSAVIPSRSANGMLRLAKLSINGHVQLTASDGTAELMIDVPDDPPSRTGDRTILVNPSRLTAILSKAKSREAIIGIDNVQSDDSEDSETRCKIRCGSAAFNLPTESADEFPEFGEFDTVRSVILSADDFRQLVTETVPWTDVESVRYALGGVAMEVKDSAVTFAATDSRRLGFLTRHGIASGEFDATQPPVIPANVLQQAARACESDNVTICFGVKIETGKSADGEPWRIETPVCEISSHGFRLRSPLVDGRFPRFRDVVPAMDQFGHVVTFDRKQLIEAIETATVCASDSFCGMDFSFTVPTSSYGGVCKMETSSDEGNATVELAVDTPVNRKPLDGPIVLDPRFVLEYAKLVRTESVHMAMIAPEHCAMMFADGHAQYIIMPLSRDR